MDGCFHITIIQIKMEENHNSTEQKLFEFIEESYSLNKPQVVFANYLLKDLNKDYKTFHFVRDFEIQKEIEEKYNLSISRDDIAYTLDKLQYSLYLIDKHYSYESYRLTHDGKEILQKYDDLIVYLISEIKDNFELAVEDLKEKNLKEQIDNLTLKQLKGTIFQVNKWWLILLINAIGLK